MKRVEIKKVRSFMKGEVAMVCINDTIYLSQKQVAGLGYHNPKALIGAIIEVEYYKVGDKLLNDKECTKDDTIVKNFSIEDSADDLRLAKQANAARQAGCNVVFN